MREVTLHTDEPPSIISSQPRSRGRRYAQTVYFYILFYIYLHVQSAAAAASLE